MTTQQAGLNGGSAITTAHIETLTATVNTLVVGSRQITLSVAKQLDMFKLPYLKVMGRVRIDRYQDDLVIGTAPNGSLALSQIKLACNWDLGPCFVLPPESIRACRGFSRDQRDVHLSLEAKFETERLHSFRVNREACVWCDNADHLFEPGCAIQVVGSMSIYPDMKARVLAWDAAAADDRARCEDARSAPLIVLAGLR